MLDLTTCWELYCAEIEDNRMRTLNGKKPLDNGHVIEYLYQMQEYNTESIPEHEIPY